MHALSLRCDSGIVIIASMSDVTQLLDAISRGDSQATDRLLPLVYDELRRLATLKLADEKPGQTLQATALVHEAYLRLVGAKGSQHWDGRGHFFAAAAEAMRRILINRARDRKRLKRGGDRRRIDLDHLELALDADDDQLLMLDQALETLSKEDPQAAELIKLRFFTGLSVGETAKTMGISNRTAERLWSYARAWLYDRLRRGDTCDD